MQPHKLLLLLGPSVSGIGTCILFFDFFADDLKDRLNFLQWYQRKIGETTDKLTANRTPRNLVSIEGQDIADMERILIEGTTRAMRANETKITDLMDAIDVRVTRGRRYRLFAICLVLVGTVLAAFGAAIDAGGDI